VGTDYANATPRSVQIRLVPPGVIVAPTGPSFTVTPGTLAVAQVGFFNASASTAPDGRKIEIYDWDFGDGTKKHIVGSAYTTHDFMAVGTFTVVLTVTDSAGVSASTARLVKVVAE
jgi:PKD repeat protein